jgi:hypothetical protein
MRLYDFLKNMHHEQIADLLGNFRAASNVAMFSRNVMMGKFTHR